MKCPPLFSYHKGNAFEPQDSKCCRICLEEEYYNTDDDKSTQTKMSDMIAPCDCKGSQKWTHRHCLDQWRANAHDRAFAQCTECRHYYQFERPPLLGREWSRRAKFCLFVSRDVFLVTFLVQLVVCSLGYVAMLVDQQQFDSGLVRFLDYGVCAPDSAWCQQELAVYYLCGTLALFVLLGFFGLMAFCCNRCRIPDLSERTRREREIQDPVNRPRGAPPAYRNRRAQSSCCGGGGCCGGGYGGGGYYYSGNTSYIYIGDSGGGGGGGAAGGGCDGCQGASCEGAEACSGCGKCCAALAKVLLIVGLILVIIMAIIGFCIGIVMTVVIVQNIAQNHLFRLQKKQLVEEFRVVDLSATKTGGLLARYPIVTDEEANRGDGGSMPLQSKKELRPDDETRLRELGLWMD